MNEDFAVITGSTKGIGKEIAKKLLESHYKVIINYSNDDIAYERFIEENKRYKDKIYCIKMNLNTYENAINFCNKVKEITKKIKILILNCGVTEKTDFGKITKESWENAMNINLNCPFYIVQELSNIIGTTKDFGGWRTEELFF